MRKALDLTQQEFANRLGVKRGTVATYERGNSDPSDAAIMLICREFNVNEEWLRTGSGEMLQELSRDDEIAAFIGDVLRSESDSFRKRFIAVLSRLDSSDWEVLEKIAQQMAYAAAAPPHDSEAAKQAEWEREADAFAEIARQQFLSEKLQESQASSAKRSGGPGGVA